MTEEIMEQPAEEIREETERWYQSPFFSKKPKKP